MYNDHFGFKQKPFKLVPDPEFLFLGVSHKEALAHLKYAVDQGDGFVVITGEVGTGKTTLCRAFLEALPAGTESAYIFNPKLDAIELLKSINAEFAIGYDADSTKDLIDTLNAFLLSLPAAAIVLIDEAHKLATDVLEQLRLLSNLETTRHKLLQIILVGQPELAETLASHELRQLRHRISLSCRLEAFNRHETEMYIRHRLSVAAGTEQVRFSPAAIGCIFRYSKGIPRLVNIACDRALLTAFGLGEHHISRRITRAAVNELRSGAVRSGLRRRYPVVLLVALVFVASILVWRVAPWQSKTLQGSGAATTTPVAVVTPSPELVAPIPTPSPTATPNLPETLDRKDFLERLAASENRVSRRQALRSVLSRWQAAPLAEAEFDWIASDGQYFRMTARSAGLQLRRTEADLALLARLNMPAVLTLEPVAGDVRYIGLHQLNRQNCRVALDGHLYQLDTAVIVDIWNGLAFIPWRNFYHLTGTIPYDAPAESIITLKMLLNKVGFDALGLTPEYDLATETAVRQLQKDYQIPADGVVGSTTKMVLYSAVSPAAIPRINAAQQGASGGPLP